MIKITLLEAAGFIPAVNAMRLPKKSGDRSDSHACLKWDSEQGCWGCPFDYIRPDCAIIGDKDDELSSKLIKAGSDHRKHIRMIQVWAEIEAPMYWWKQFDTYRMGVEKVSESIMHTFKKEEFSVDLGEYNDIPAVAGYLEFIENHRKTDDINDLSKLIPQGFIQKRVVMMSYEALRNMYHARKNHKLKEWHDFCDWVKTLPHSEWITCEAD